MNYLSQHYSQNFLCCLASADRLQKYSDLQTSALLHACTLNLDIQISPLPPLSPIHALIGNTNVNYFCRIPLLDNVSFIRELIFLVGWLSQVPCITYSPTIKITRKVHVIIYSSHVEIFGFPPNLFFSPLPLSFSPLFFPSFPSLFWEGGGGSYPLPPSSTR